MTPRGAGVGAGSEPEQGPSPIRIMRISGPAALTIWGFSLLASCAGSPTGGDSGLEAGDHELNLRHQGRNRWALVHVPPAASAGERLPLLLALHGGGGNPDQFKADAGLDAVADREGFLVFYPAGTGVLPRTLLTWNAGTDCCGYALEEDVDDVGFLLSSIDDLDSRTPVDLDRVYVTGHSNGGIMAYRLAAEAADRVAAIVPVAGAMMLDAFSPGRAVPVLHIHSVDDGRALYEGGLGPPFPIGGGQVLHRPVMEGITAWVSRNGCPAQPVIVETREGTPGAPNEDHSAEKLRWAPCSSGAPVEHWRLHGPGHAWPGSTVSPAQEALVGETTTIVIAAEEIWSFARQFRLP
jgi:polyhydroxybutyrate depolymerase